MRNKKICRNLYIGTALTVLLIDGAVAQEIGSGPPGNNQLEEIVVTAQRRGEALQDVPIQISAFSETKILDAGIKNTRDFIALVPNVSFDESSPLRSAISVRGNSQLLNGDSPVAVVVDGVPQNKQQKMNLFDIERIEVLKGPQGGLYGRNAVGGAINIITKAPSDELEGMAEASYGRGNALDLLGSVSTPLADGVGFRLAGTYRSDDGRIRNRFRGDYVDTIDNDWEVRGRLDFDLSERIKADLRVSYRDTKGGGPYLATIYSGRPNDYQAPSGNVPGYEKGYTFDVSGKIDIDLGGVKLTSITARTDTKTNVAGDGDLTNLVDYPAGFAGTGIGTAAQQVNPTKLTSQEVRLVSDDKKPFRWIVGAYYLDTKDKIATTVAVDVDGTTDHIQDPATQIFSAREADHNKAYAFYASADYDIDEHLTLSAALRYDNDRRSKTDKLNGFNRKATFDAWQPKATVTYKLTPEKMAYATYSKAFRSGGFNAIFTPIPIFKEEKLENYEVGFKTSWLHKKLIVNGAYYRSYSNDMQYFVFRPPVFQLIDNIDRARLSGVELEVQALVARGFQLFASLGTNDTKILRNSADPTSVGNKTPRTTRWMATAGFQYETPVTDTIDMMARLDYQHHSKRYWEVNNATTQKAINLVDVRAGFQTKTWSVFGFGRNIFNVKYFTEFATPAVSGSPNTTGIIGRPVSYGLEFRYRF